MTSSTILVVPPAAVNGAGSTEPSTGPAPQPSGTGGTLGGHSVSVGSTLNGSVAPTSNSTPHSAFESLRVLGFIGPQRSPAPAAITGGTDGESREFVQKSYWEHGFWTGVYYLFQYIFMWPSDQKVMNFIYKAVADAANEKRLVNVAQLGHALFEDDACEVDNVFSIFQNHLSMPAHALGSQELAKDLFEAYRVAGKFSDNEVR